MGTPAVPKCLFASPLTVHVESVRVGENVLVSVGGLVGDDYAFAGLDELRIKE
jgi:hypothetical protein